MRILHYCGDRTGVFMYRAYFPSVALMDSTEHNVLFSRNCDTGNPHCLLEMNWCDIAIFHRQYEATHTSAINYLKKIGKVVIFEIDDDWWHLNEDNPQYKNFHNNKHILGGLEEALRASTAITTTNKRLAKILKKFNKNVYIVPNYISKQFFKRRAEVQEKINPENITLMWSGAQNHMDDMKSLVKPLEILFKKYDNIQMFVVGANYTPLFPFIPKRKLMYVPWMGLDDYPSTFTWCDIGLAPMTKNHFNASKSNIRVLEMAYFGKPCVAGNIYSYKETIEHGENGFLASNDKEWVEYLSLLIENASERKRIGDNAIKLANGNSIEENYGKHVELYEELLSHG